MITGRVDQHGDISVRNRFSFLPEPIDAVWVWLEFYYQYSRYRCGTLGGYWSPRYTARAKNLTREQFVAKAEEH